MKMKPFFFKWSRIDKNVCVREKRGGMRALLRVRPSVRPSVRGRGFLCV